jgi:hypothetical protein
MGRLLVRGRDLKQVVRTEVGHHKGSADESRAIRARLELLAAELQRDFCEPVGLVFLGHGG